MSDPLDNLRILDDLAADNDQGQIVDTFVAFGFRWKISTLVEHELAWASQYIITTSPMSVMQSMRAPTLGIAIREIGHDVDGHPLSPVEQFFIKEYEAVNGPIGSQLQRAISSTNSFAKQYFFAEQMYRWLAKREGRFVEKLWSFYNQLVERRTAAADAMGKSLGAGGTSRRMSPTLMPGLFSPPPP
jgi:hypothetical protein